jgi:hypothetical protein
MVLIDKKCHRKKHSHCCGTNTNQKKREAYESSSFDKSFHLSPQIKTNQETEKINKNITMDHLEHSIVGLERALMVNDKLLYK